jgi:hypothetical protein
MRLSLSLTLSLSLSPSALSPSTKWGTLGTGQIPQEVVGCDEMMFGEDEEEEKSGITTSYYWVWSFFLGLAGQRE